MCTGRERVCAGRLCTVPQRPLRYLPLQHRPEVLRPSACSYPRNEVSTFTHPSDSPRRLTNAVTYSLVCNTEADTRARIAATGAGGIFGRDVVEDEETMYFDEY